ncbi:MAG TPA: histidine triad nucleotide-binding protein [Gemmatimonadales bacterium]|nr:histidine triad nucleotide-binding protein [Gemmatimonadales bacterium]
MMDCIFCRISSGEIPARLVFESDTVFAFHDISPQAPVHILVVPRQHAATAADLVSSPGGGQVMAELLNAAVEVARQQGLAEQGYRFVINTGRQGGQTVDHLHLHILGGRPMGWPPG